MANKSSFLGRPIYSLFIPKETTWQPLQALHLTNTLLAQTLPCAFRLTASNMGVCWEFIDLAAHDSYAEMLFRASYPEVKIEVSNLPSPIATPCYAHRVVYALKHPNWFPITYVTDIEGIDPLSTIAQSLSYLQPNEYVVHTLIVHRKNTPPIWKVLNISDEIDKAFPQQQFPGINKANHTKQIIYDKMKKNIYECFFQTEIFAPQAQRAQAIAYSLTAQMVVFDRVVPSQPYNGFQYVSVDIGNINNLQESQHTGFLAWYENLYAKQNPRKEDGVIYLETHEIAALWHLPHEGFAHANVVWTRREAEVPPAIARNAQGILLGTATHQGREVEVRILSENRQTHMNIVGKTRMGKSTLLHNLIHQDIQSGAGVTVIDPHGMLVRDILYTSIPPHREKDVILFDLSQNLYPAPLNPFRGHPGQTGLEVILGVIERLFPDTAEHARLSMYFRAVLSLLQADKEATIQDMERIFYETEYRNALLANTTNSDVMRVWKQYSQMSDKEQQKILEPILSRISPFYTNEYLKYSLCHPDGFDFRKCIKQQKILLISLNFDQEHVPTLEKEILGALLISRIQMAGMKDIGAPHFIYIDEVQDFVTTSLPELLSGAGKFNMWLTIAHQFFGQLPRSVSEAVMGNVGATITFRCSPDDASALAPHMRPQIQTDDLVNLNTHQVAVKVQQGTQTQPAFLLNTNKPPQLSSIYEAKKRAERITWNSTKTYTPRTKNEVEYWLNMRYGRAASSHPPHSPSQGNIKPPKPGNTPPKFEP